MLLESFSQSFFGSEAFYETAQRLAVKFKYTLSDSDLVKILRATIMAKQKPNIDLVNLMQGVNRKELPLCSLMQAYDYVTLALNMDTKNMIQEDSRGYVEHRSELVTRNLPNVAQRKSYKVLLKEGETYFYCTCGLSANQPFCDGAHKDAPGYKPLKFTYTEEDKIRGLCGCKMN